MTEQFLAADLTTEEALEKLEEIESRMIPDENLTKDRTIELQTGLIVMKFDNIGSEPTDEEITEIKSMNDELNELLGK